MTKPTLLVMAAGMGSRYGSLKQMDGVGASGEAIIDYSIYDAVRAGFGKVVFVIRHAFEEEFHNFFHPARFGGMIAVEFAFQELDCLPEGFTVPAGREKPWGTNHAVMMGREVVNEPFAAINADDFYGRNAFEEIARYLKSVEGMQGEYCMMGYRLQNTMSEFGSVSRGICEADANGFLTGMVERTTIVRDGERFVWIDNDGDKHEIDRNAPVSMNMFGFTPDYFEMSERIFKDFLRENASNPKAEFYIPTAVNTLVKGGNARMKILDTTSRWFGVTYKDDRPGVVAKIRALVDAGEYPVKLWK